MLTKHTNEKELIIPGRETERERDEEISMYEYGYNISNVFVALLIHSCISLHIFRIAIYCKSECFFCCWCHMTQFIIYVFANYKKLLGDFVAIAENIFI